MLNLDDFTWIAEEGKSAAICGLSESANPYGRLEVAHNIWLAGYRDAAKGLTYDKYGRVRKKTAKPVDLGR